jgi:hypothetical protein
MSPLKFVAAVLLLAAIVAFSAGIGGPKSADAIQRGPDMRDLFELARLRAQLENQALRISRPDHEETSTGVTVFRGTPR